MKIKKLTLGWQIMIGLILGIILGIVFYHNNTAITTMQNIGTMFINLIQMIVLPIVVSCLTVGIASIGDIKKLGRIGGKTIIYFEVMTTIAIVLGLIVGNLTHPGSFINIHGLKGDDISKYLATANSAKESGGWGLVMNLIPTNFFKALSEGNMMPIIVFTIFFGLGTAAIGKQGQQIVDLLDAVSQVMFKVTNWVMKLSPIGVCGLIGATLAQMGVGALLPLGYFVFLAYATMIVFVLVIMGIAAKIFHFSLKNLLLVIKNEIVLAFSTASSEATLPHLIDKMQKFGVSKSIVSFVIPTGYTFNLDGSAIYQSLAVVFLAQAYNIHLSIVQQIMILLVLIVTSKGMAGVPGASFVVLLATVGSVGIPVSGLAFIAGIDRFVDMGRTAVNVVGNSLATAIIGSSEHQFDKKQSDQYVKEYLQHGE